MIGRGLMLTSILDEFLLKKQNDWLLKKNNGKMPEGDKLLTLKAEAEARYSLKTWFPDTIKQSRFSSTHPSTFSHPDAKTTPISFNGVYKNDGYFRTGNVKSSVDFDVFGNAATDNKVYDLTQFLRIEYFNGLNVLNLFELGHEDAKGFCELFKLDIEEVKDTFSKCSNKPSRLRSSKLVKQVYFPVTDGYHQLSILSSSVNITTLKHKIDSIRFSKSASEARESRRNGQLHESGYDDILELTVTGYGGTQPQNVSVLNSQNAGRAYLLKSAPPTIEKRAVRLPTSDFFSQSLRSWLFKEPMLELHKFMALDINNMKIRAAISNTIVYIAKMVVKEASTLRDAETGWSAREHYHGLDEFQRIWLDDAHISTRLEQSDWIKPLSRQFARWFLATYEKVLSSDAFTLGDQELFHVESFIIETLEADEELLK
jgi:CRISPR-associated protein Csy1